LIGDLEDKKLYNFENEKFMEIVFFTTSLCQRFSTFCLTKVIAAIIVEDAAINDGRFDVMVDGGRQIRVG
jgi:hypothetical protein